jgi:MFS family permease
MLAFAPVASWLMRTFGAKYALALGGAVLGAGYLVSFFLMSAPWQILLAAIVCSAGVGIGYAAMPTLVMDAVPMAEAGSAVGVNALMRSLGTTTASAVMAALLTSQTTVVRDLGGISVPSESAFHLCFLVAAVAAFVGAALALTIPASQRD